MTTNDDIEFEGEDFEDDDLLDDEDGIEVEMDEEVAQGIYSNMVISTFNREEFVLDFVFIQPQMQKGRIRSRMVLSPRNAKRLAILLQGDLEEYEETYGSISDDPSSGGIHFSIN